MQVKFFVTLRGEVSAEELVRNSLSTGSAVQIRSKPMGKGLIEYSILINNKFRFTGACKGFNGDCLGWQMEVLK